MDIYLSMTHDHFAQITVQITIPIMGRVSMNKLAKFAMLSSALLFSQTAFAHHPLPENDTLSGLVDVYKGINLQCVLTVDITTDLSGQRWATVSLTPGDSLCDQLVFNNSPYKVDYDENTQVVWFRNVDVTTITAGDCAGDISGTWLPDVHELDVDSFLPAKTAGAPCTISGFIY